ncbi:MAG: REP-associated tyrosine transposase [Gammaproteobacteria bacterium]
MAPNRVNIGIVTDTPRPAPKRGHALRRGRFSSAGHSYLLTSVTHRRQAFFADFASARIVARSLTHFHRAGHCQSLAWVIMPDHLHWLVTLDTERSLSGLMRSFKTWTAHRLNLHADHAGRRVWQPGFHDHAVRRDEDLRAMARYVIANPLRAGLVSRVGDYPFWDAMWL